jgi:hypothetical protein
MTAIRVLDEDQARLAQIETDVNEQRATLGLPTFAGGDIISGCIQVGMNAFTNGRDEIWPAGKVPTISIDGLPYSDDNVIFPPEIDDRVGLLSASIGMTESDFASMALHAGCLVMSGETNNQGYRPASEV